MKTLETRINAWLDLATAAQTATGRTWYADARTFCREVAQETGVPFANVCGVTAALSPSTYWALNKRQAEALCTAYAAGDDLADVPLSTYGGQVNKAIAILSASPADIPAILGRRAFKTWAFYDCLIHEESAEVAVDRHVVNSLDYLARFTQSARKPYYCVVHAFRAVAAARRLRPYEAQAIVWITYKEHAEAYNAEERHDRAVAGAEVAPF